jgi:hypothetical protein
MSAMVLKAEDISGADYLLYGAPALATGNIT